MDVRNKNMTGKKMTNDAHRRTGLNRLCRSVHAKMMLFLSSTLAGSDASEPVAPVLKRFHSRRPHVRNMVLILVVGLVVGLRGNGAWGQQQQDTKPVDQKSKRLGERLVREAVKKTEEDLMAAIVRLMNESARNLEIDFDPGSETLTKQEAIVDKLDEAIKAASAQRRKKRSKQKQWQGDQRKKSKPGKPQNESSKKSSQQMAGKSSSDMKGQKGSPTGADADGGNLQETRRAWGLLPQRQRDEVIQGSREMFLERYRQWIERYYQALQESDQ